MMTKNYWKAFALLLCFSFAIVACDDDEDPVVDVTTPPAAPTGLMATSLNMSTVGLKWTASADEAETNFAGYELTVSDANGQIGDAMTIATGITTQSIDNLVEGTVYTFSLVAITDDATVSTTPATVSWSPATRFDVNMYSLYDAGSALGSGLELFFADDNGPSVVRVGGANNEAIDVVFHTASPAFDLLIGSPTESPFMDPNNPGQYNNGGVAKTTLIGKVWDNVEDFDDVYDSEALNATEMTEKIVDFTAKTGSFVFSVQTADNHFAKVLVRRVNGSFLQEDAAGSFVSVTVSYQKVAGVAFAKSN